MHTDLNAPSSTVSFSLKVVVIITVQCIWPRDFFHIV